MDLRSRSRMMESEPPVRTSSGYPTDLAPVAPEKFEEARAGIRPDGVHPMRAELLSIWVIRTNEKADSSETLT